MTNIKSKKQLPKKLEKRKTEAAEELLPIFQDLINTSSDIMKVPKVELLSVELKNHLLHFKLKNGETFSSVPSAFYTILRKIFEDAVGFSPNLLFVINPAQASLYRAFFSRRASPIVLRLTKFLADNENEPEARLCAIQSQILEDFRKGIVQTGEDFQEGVQIGKDLFSKLKLKSEKLLVASSETVQVMKLLPLIKDPDTNEVLFSSFWALRSLPMAIVHASGKKREDLFAQLKEAQFVLEKNPHQLLRDYSQLFSSILDGVLKTSDQ